jgi:O-antigen ligase
VAIASVANSTWRLGSAAVVLAFALDPLGDLPNAVVLIVVLLAAMQVVVGKPVDDTTNVTLLVLTAIIVSIAALEMLNPNVPSLGVGLLGFRKSATFLLGIVIGVGWRGSRMHALRLTWWCMFVAASVSLVAHLGLPSIEQSIPRSAGKYTALLGGEERMQGLLAGPFHVSMLGVFLFLSALAPGVVIQRRSLRLVAATVGLACVYFAQVRTGLVALAIGALAMMLVTGSAQTWAKRLTLLSALSVLGVVYINSLTEYASQFTAFRLLIEGGLEDTRFTGRFTSWSKGLDMIDRSPIFGFGSGSAGDTLGQYFAAGEHVTSHNTFLKYAVEGGVIQGFLVASLCIGLVLAVRPRQDRTRFGIAAGVTFLVFAFVGAAPESIPVSFGLAVILGLCAGRQATVQAHGASATAGLYKGVSEELYAGQEDPDVGIRV